jgi:hypothetical protein
MMLSAIGGSRAIAVGAAVLAGSLLCACGGGGRPPIATVQGTVAVGAALANASVQLACKNGSDSTTSNANGAYVATFNFDAPCVITATSGSVTLNSIASGGGTYNVTPLTELLLSYLAGQLGTTVNGLVTGLTTNSSFQAALTNSTTIANAETAVATLVQNQYGVTLSTNAFLTTSFTPGEAGADADLDNLQTAGAITNSGQPSPSLASAALAAGQAAPLTTSPTGTPTGGTGGTGGTGS